MDILLTAALALLLCWLVDLGFTKLFRSKAQHRSGRSVRLSKRNGSFGAIMGVLGVACIFAGTKNGWLLPVCGIVLILGGLGLVVYYLTFGIYYDEDSFLYSSFGKKSKTYRFGDICSQQLYINGSQTIIELHMADGSAVLLQSSMTDVYPFLDHAHAAWRKQTGRSMEDCPYYDPANSCWFPRQEDI